MSVPASLLVACQRCDRELEDPFGPCPRCLREGVSVNGMTRPAASAHPSLGELAGVFLPPGMPELPSTPLRPAARLGDELGSARLLIKDERTGPTHSYKDRLARVAALRARESGAEVVVVSSSGNHGAAMASAATAAAMRSMVLTLTSIPFALRRLIEGVGGELVAFERPEDRWEVMRQAVAELGWFPAGNFHAPAIGSNPYAVDGYQPIAWEIVEQLGAAPDWVAVPVGYGDGLSGIAKGFRSLTHAGLLERVPRMLAIETTGSLGAALEERIDQPRSRPVLAPNALSIACPQGTYQSLNAIRDSDGVVVTVDDAAALAARRAASRLEGCFLELSSAAAFAGVRLAIERGHVGRDETMVVVATSVGLKDQLLPDEDDVALPATEPTLDALLALAAGWARGSERDSFAPEHEIDAGEHEP